MNDEAAQAELIRQRRETAKAYATPQLPEVEPVTFVKELCQCCDVVLTDHNRSPRAGVCSRCYEELESPQPSGFWSREFFIILLVGIPLTIGAAILIGEIAWRLFR